MEMRNLSASMRPQKFSEIIGQHDLKKQLFDQFTKRVPMVVMLVGPPGTGKTTLAKIIALSVQERDGIFGEPSAATLADQDLYNLDIFERNAADANKIEDMRALMPQLRVAPAFGRYKVFILDEAQQVTTAAQNLLLKPLEDATSNNIFIFGTTDPGKILPAIKRRAMIFRVPELQYAEMQELIERCYRAVKPNEPISLDRVNALADALWKNDIKAGGLVVMAAERYFTSNASLEEVVILQQAGTIDVNSLCSWVMQGNWNEARGILAKATLADTDHIRASLAYRLSAKLIETTISERANRLAQFIHEISSQSIFEEGIQLRATIASIYKICAEIDQVRREAVPSPIKFQPGSVKIG